MRSADRVNVRTLTPAPFLAALLFACDAFAQQPVADSDDAIEEIVVTGSRILRRDFTSPSPITSIDRQALEFSGQPTLEEALNQMPQMQPDLSRTSNNPGNGTSRLNLRGLGSERTLVMLNGRRLAPSGVGSSIDVNNLPQLLVERVEIITGGASTVYGSDAIAGVVNFITRDDVDGLGIDASTYATEDGDSEINDFNILYGRDFGSGRGNVRIFGGALDRRETFASERELTSNTISDTWAGSLIERGSPTIPGGVVFAPDVDLGNGPQRIRFDDNGDPVPFIDPDDRYNFAPVNYLQTPLRRYSAGLFVNYELGADLETYVEYTVSRNEASQTLAPVPAATFFVINPDNPVLTPQTQQIAANQFIPAGPGVVGFAFGRRLSEVGLRIIENERDYSRIAAGLRGSISENWDFDVWLTYTDGDEEEILLNDVSASRIQQGLLVNPATNECFDPSNGCVPLNLFGAGNLSEEGASFIRLPPLVNTTKRTQRLLSGFVRGSAFDTWAGPVDTAFGIEWRKDQGRFIADQALFTGDGLGYRGQSGISGREEVIEAYGEAIVPLLAGAPLAEYVALELGARYSKYNNAGEVDSYKAGGEWLITDGVRVRTMLQRSVRAPNLAEAFEEQFIELGFLSNSSRDPCSASADPVGNGNADRCIAQGVPADQIGIFEASIVPIDFVNGGNPALEPEVADTFTVGVVLSLDALPSWRFAVDYFDLEIEDTIGEIDPGEICFDPSNPAGLFCDNITRDASTYNINRIFQPTSNRGRSTATGIDTQLSFEAELPDWMAFGAGSPDLDVNLIWTRMLDATSQENPVATVRDCLGRFGWPCSQDTAASTFPENRITTNARYTSGPVDVHLTWRWIDGTENAAPLGSFMFGVPDPILQVPTVGSKSYFDLGIGYTFSNNIAARLNIANLFDRDPPLMPDVTNNTDTLLYDIFGRSYHLALSLNY